MRAALKGGYAHLIAMANTDPVIATPALVEENQRKAARLRLCALTQAAAAGEALGDEAPTDRAALSRVTSVLSNDGKTIFSDEFMRQLLIDSVKYGFLISTHCQPERKASWSGTSGFFARSAANLHIGHVSRAETVDMVRRAKAEGLQLTCEVTPHHLFGWDSDYKVNPPLRHARGCGSVDRGHSGWNDRLPGHRPTRRTRRKIRQNGMAGISNIEYAFSVYLKVFTEHGIPLTRLSRMLSHNPAKRLGIKAGLLQPGYPASITALAVEEESEIDAFAMISRSHNTPFHGRKVQGRILKTIVEGENEIRIRKSNLKQSKGANDMSMERLVEAVQQKGPVCVGLDTQLSFLPEYIKKKEASRRRKNI